MSLQHILYVADDDFCWVLSILRVFFKFRFSIFQNRRQCNMILATNLHLIRKDGSVWDKPKLGILPHEKCGAACEEEFNQNHKDLCEVKFRQV